MKKLLSSLFIVTLLTFSSEGVMAQAYQKGDKLLNVGIGFGGYYNGVGYGAGGVPIGASFEYGITDQISVGAQADFYSRNLGLGLGSDYRVTIIPIAIRGSYHVNELLNLDNDKIDLYGGLQLGYTIANVNYAGYGGSSGDVLFGVHLGGRYYFKPNLGAFAELGYGVSALKLGVTFKF